MRFALVVLLAQAATAAPPTTCTLEGEYERALCAYQRRDFGSAESVFAAIAEGGAPVPRTIQARYFLARTMMKTGRFEEASAQLIRIYSLDPRFYDTWNCDFLLGECRKAMGKR